MPAGSKAKTARRRVYILCNLSLDMPGRRAGHLGAAYWRPGLSDALAACDERVWGALPLAPKDLTRLFPHLWPPSAGLRTRTPRGSYYCYIIRVWRVLNDYRPKGQTSWSKALVRHGAEARAAIAAVLGVPAEDIGVRDLTRL